MVHEIMQNYLDIEWNLKDYKDVLFGDFENDDKDYLKLSDTKTLITTLDLLLEDYNVENN